MPARRGDAAEDDVLLPQAHERPAASTPYDAPVDWLGSLPRLRRGHRRRILRDCPTRAEREPVLRAGKGGDDTTAIDAAAEDAVVDEARGARGRLPPGLGGARGAAFGSGGPMRIVVDPIDGSVNAKRGIPFFCALLAVAGGADDGRRRLRLRLRLRRPRGMDRARQGCGAQFNGAPAGRGRLRRTRSRSSPSRRPRRLHRERRPQRCSGSRSALRVMGSLALSLCHLAAGRVDAVVLAQAGPFDRHRGCAAPRARVRLRDRPLRGAAVHRGSARSRRTLARRRCRDAGAV